MDLYSFSDFHPMTFFQKKLSKSHFFEKLFFSKIDFFEKSNFLKRFNISLDFFSWKTFFVEIFCFSLFMIYYPQAVQCWASNSSTYTFGHGLCVRHFLKNPTNPEKSPIRPSCIKVFHHKKTIATFPAPDPQWDPIWA